MTYASDTFNGDGSTTEFTLTFQFIQRDHVNVSRIDKNTKVVTALSVVTSGQPTGDQYIWETDTKIKVGTAPTVDDDLLIVRDTPENAQIIVWKDGSYIVAEDLNTSDKQWLYNIQELEDQIDLIDGGIVGSAVKQVTGTSPVVVDNTDVQRPVVSVDAITKAEAQADPTNPAWDNDDKLATVGAIDCIYKQIVGTGATYGGKRKLGQIRIDNTGSTPRMFYWDANAATPAWVEVQVQGPIGPPGEDAKVDVDPNTVTGLPGSDAEVENTGTSSDAKFKFTIPRGDKGEPGVDGTNPTVAVDSTVTGLPGTNASVVNTGTSQAAKFKFTIPRGDVGPQGPPGDGVDYKGPIDPTQPNSEPSDPDNGDFYVSTATGSTTWTGLTTVQDGTRLVWNEGASKWDAFTPVGNVNLSYIPAADQGTIFNSTGTDAVVPLVDDNYAGLMSPADKQKLDDDSGGFWERSRHSAEINYGLSPKTITDDVVIGGLTDTFKIRFRASDGAASFAGNVEVESTLSVDGEIAVDQDIYGPKFRLYHSSGLALFEGAINVKGASNESRIIWGPDSSTGPGGDITYDSSVKLWRFNGLDDEPSGSGDNRVDITTDGEVVANKMTLALSKSTDPGTPGTTVLLVKNYSNERFKVDNIGKMFASTYDLESLPKLEDQ